MGDPLWDGDQRGQSTGGAGRVGGRSEVMGAAGGRWLLTSDRLSLLV